MKGIIYFFIFIIAFLGLAVAVVFVKHEFIPVIETKSGGQKQIPSDMKMDILKDGATTEIPTYKVPILMYHYVEYVADLKDTIRVSLNVNPDVFEEQIKTLIANDYTFMTAKELGEVLDNKMKMPAKPILLTFDDGHWDFDTEVLPILKKYNVKATAYIITGFIGGSDFMTKEQLQDVVSSGLVDVGAHTVHHIALSGRLYLVQKYEIEQSKSWLENNYNINVVSFAYPEGSFDRQAADIVKGAGYTTAVSTIAGESQSLENRFYLYRLRPGYRTGISLTNFIDSTQ